MIKRLLAALALILAGPVLAQSTATPSQIGYLDTSGCSYGQTVCFKQYGATVPVSGSLTPSGTQDVNLKNVGGNAVSTGAGATGTGSQRTTVAQDTTTIAGSAPGTAGTPSANVVSVQGIASGTNLPVNVTNSSLVVIGNVASGASDSGNPVKISGKYNATLPTFTDGQRGDLQIGTRGSLSVSLFGPNSTNSVFVGSGGSSFGATNNGLQVYNGNYLYESATGFNAWREIGDTGLTVAGAGSGAVTQMPSSAARAGTATSQCTVACASLTVSGTHNLYGLNLESSATGFFYLVDATSCPANGTITPKRVWMYPTASTTIAVSYNGIPTAQATGITICFSTGTSPYTATSSTTAFIGIDYQ